MYSTLEQLTKHPVFYHFAEISKIPRGSGNEKEISDYLVGFAKERNLEVIQDEALNVIIKKKQQLVMKMYQLLLFKVIWIWFAKNQATVHDFEKIQLNYESLGTCYMQIKQL